LAGFKGEFAGFRGGRLRKRELGIPMWAGEVVGRKGGEYIYFWECTVMRGRKLVVGVEGSDVYHTCIIFVVRIS
jgi:hypothetical protein